MLGWPNGTTINAASSGPIEVPKTAADLKHRLRETEAPTGGKPRDTRRLRVEDRRTQPTNDAATRMTVYCRATLSSSSPKKVNPMPMASENGCAFLSVK